MGHLGPQGLVGAVWGKGPGRFLEGVGAALPDGSVPSGTEGGVAGSRAVPGGESPGRAPASGSLSRPPGRLRSVPASCSQLRLQAGCSGLRPPGTTWATLSLSVSTCERGDSACRAVLPSVTACDPCRSGTISCARLLRHTESPSSDLGPRGWNAGLCCSTRHSCACSRSRSSLRPQEVLCSCAFLGWGPSHDDSREAIFSAGNTAGCAELCFNRSL